MSRSHTRQIIRHTSPRKERAPAAPVPSTDDVAEALFQAMQTVKQHGRLCIESDEALRPISMPRARVLMVLEDAAGRPVRMSDLAAALCVTPRNVTTIVDGLERDGYVVRQPDPTDRRAILLKLTEFGQTHMERIHKLHHAVGETIFAALDADERRELVRLLTKIVGPGLADPSCPEP